MHTETSLAADPRSASAARRHVTETLRSWGLEERVDAAALLASELVSNAVRHAGTDIELIVHREEPPTAADGPGREDRSSDAPECVHLEVRDYSNAGVAFARPSTGATGGRGLALLTALSPRWGVQPCPPSGKVVWCEVPGREESVLPIMQVDATAARWD